MELDTRLTTVEAAAIAGVARGTVLNWIHKGYLGDCERQMSQEEHSKAIVSR